MNVAVSDAVAFSLHKSQGIIADIAEAASVESHIRRVLASDSVASDHLKCNILHKDPAAFSHHKKRLVQHGNDYLCVRVYGFRVEICLIAVIVYIIVSGPVHLLQHMVEAEPLSLFIILIAVGRMVFYEFPVRIQLPDPLHGICPVIGPVAKGPYLSGFCPVLWTLVLIVIAAFQFAALYVPVSFQHLFSHACDGQKPVSFGILGQIHGDGVQKQFRMGGRHLTGVSPGYKAACSGNSRFRQIAYINTVSDLRVKSGRLRSL